MPTHTIETPLGVIVTEREDVAEVLTLSLGVPYPTPVDLSIIHAVFAEWRDEES